MLDILRKDITTSVSFKKGNKKMSRELNFDGYWEGDAVYSCDQCGKESKRFRFDSEDVGSKRHRAELREQGWITTKVDDKWHDFCCESCRNKYIRTQTI